jgi:hypothetical protein
MSAQPQQQHPSLGTSSRTKCYDCPAPTENTLRCTPCKEAYNAKRREKRKHWHEEGRCWACGRVVLQVNPNTGELFANCLTCRRRDSRRYHARKGN